MLYRTEWHSDINIKSMYDTISCSLISFWTLENSLVVHFSLTDRWRLTMKFVIHSKPITLFIDCYKILFPSSSSGMSRTLMLIIGHALVWDHCFQETSLELVMIGEDGVVQSASEQSVFGIIKDLAILRWNEEYRESTPQVC